MAVKVPLKPPSIDGVMGKPDALQKILKAGLKPTVNGKYRHWDTLRQLAPPDGLTSEEWWTAIKLARVTLYRPLPMTDSDGRAFRLAMPDPAWEMVHQIDQQASGEIAFSDLVANPQSRRRYLVSSLIEEAITSSQLEGATTTGRVAKEMIKSGRKPRTVSEQMIFNNYRAMTRIIDWAEATPVSRDSILELHRLLTEGTLEDPNDAGRIQAPGEARVVVTDRADGKVLHTPPPAEMLEARLASLVEFANGGGYDGFLHPVVRAVLVHFWLAYDHPFVDGNGRTARALFYWVMVRSGYWLTEFLSISRILRKAPSQYGAAFLYTETDDQDATYFVLYQLRVIVRAIDELHEYLKRKMREIREAEELLKGLTLNRRQLALISHALRNPDAEYTFKSHMTSHKVVYETARSDLLNLAEQGFLLQFQIGREYVFRATPDLADRLRAAGGGRGGGALSRLRSDNGIRLVAEGAR